MVSTPNTARKNVESSRSRRRRRRGERAPQGPPEFAELSLGAIGELGDASAEFESATINVAGGLPGERVVARIYRYRRRRKPIVSAIVERVIEPSPDRVAPKCGYCGPCSGCQWQHVAYAAQLGMKRGMITRQLDRYESLRDVPVADTLPAPSVFYYRNHARFTVRYGGQLGFSNRITRRFVRIDHCMLMSPNINAAVTELQDRSAETSNLSVRVGVNTGDRLIQPTFQNPDIPIASGQKRYVEKMLGRELRIASPSFFQVNTEQAETLIELARDGLNLQPGDVLVDAYAGVGVFAILLAPYVRRAIAIEESASAIEDGRLNADGLDNVEFVQERTERALGELDSLCSLDAPPDAVILDPPRVGCHPDALDALARLRPSRVAYVSCDPPSLARDLDILVGSGYEVASVQPVDMFPQTYHVESVTTLRLGAG